MNNKVLEDNLTALEDKLLIKREELLKKLNIENNDNSQIIMDKSVNNEDIVAKYSASGRLVYLNSRYDALEAARIWANKIKNNNYLSLYIVYGFSNGMYLSELLQTMGKENNIIVYEPDNTQFGEIIQHIDITDIIGDDRIGIIIEKVNDDLFKNMFSAICTFERVKYTSVETLPNYILLYSDKYQEFVEKCKRCSEAVRGEGNTLLNFGPEMNKNLVHNLNTLTIGTSIDILKEKISTIHNYENVPAIVVGAGPSLDKNIEELRSSKGKSFIIATDSAIRMLLLHNIIPDIVITLDSHKPLELFEDDRTNDIPLLMCMQTRYEIADKHTGKKILFSSDEFSYSLCKCFGKEISPLFNGGSVATVGFALAKYLEFKTIVFVGQDLAFTDNKKHTALAYEESGVDDINNPNYTYVEGNDGSKLLTFINFKLYKQWYEAEIAQMSDTRVINATEGGALIKGTEVKNLWEVNQEMCNEEFDTETLINNLPAVFSEKEQEQVRNVIAKLPDIGVEMNNFFSKNIRNYQKLDELARKGKISGSEVKSLISKIDENNNIVENNVYMKLLKMQVSREDHEVLEQLYDSSNTVESVTDEIHKIARNGIELLEGYLKANKQLLADLKEVIIDK